MSIVSQNLPGKILKQLSRRPMLFISTLSLGFKVSKDAVHLKRGDIDSTEFRMRTGASVGGVSLGAAGSYAGLVAGHFLMPVPVLGGLVGGFAGGALGEMMGDKLGRKAVESAESALRSKGKKAEGPAEATSSEPTPPTADVAPGPAADDSTHGTPKRHL